MIDATRRSLRRMAVAAPLVALSCAACAGEERPGAQAATGLPAPAQPSAAAAGVGHWQAGAALPVAVAEVAAAALGDSLYTGGGFTPPGDSIGRWFGRLDVAAAGWEARAALPIAVHHPGMAAAEGRVWLAGGYTGGLTRESASNQLHAYDPATDTWRRRADMPGRRAAHGLAAMDGRLYVAGGIGDAEERLWAYDIAADRWSELPGPTPREHLGVAAAGGRLYVIAGRGFGRGIVGTLEAFDPEAGTWERLPDMPQGCGGCSAAATADGQLHITGGEGGGRTYGEHAIYDPAARAWRLAAPLPTPRHGIGAAALGDRFWVIGGGRTQGLAYSDVVEWWSPHAPGPTPPPTPWAPVFAPLVGGAWGR